MVKLYISPWCPWCREVVESAVFNLLKGKNIEIIDPFSVDTRLGYFRREDILTEPSIVNTKDRTYFTSFLTKNHFTRFLGYVDLPTKKLKKKIKSF